MTTSYSSSKGPGKAAATEAATKNKYGSSGDWADVIGGVAKGIAASQSVSTSTKSAKKDAKERKRRTLAALLGTALNNEMRAVASGHEHAQDIADLKHGSMQRSAASFIKALKRK